MYFAMYKNSGNTTPAISLPGLHGYSPTRLPKSLGSLDVIIGTTNKVVTWVSKTLMLHENVIMVFVSDLLKYAFECGKVLTLR